MLPIVIYIKSLEYVLHVYYIFSHSVVPMPYISIIVSHFKFYTVAIYVIQCTHLSNL